LKLGIEPKHRHTMSPWLRTLAPEQTIASNLRRDWASIQV
jgi:hypothetical protein